MPVYNQVFSLDFLGDYAIIGSVNQISLHHRSSLKLIKTIIFPVGLIRKVLHGKDTKVYLGTDKGLYTYNLNDNSIKPTAFTGNAVYAMIYDQQKGLWLSSSRGIHRVTENKIIESITFNQGLQDWEFNSNAVDMAEDGELFFGGVKGCNSFYPRIDQNNEKPGFYIDGVHSRAQKYDYTCMSKEVLVFSENCNPIMFKLRVSGSQPQNSYNKQYKIEGITNGWVDMEREEQLIAYFPGGKHKVFFHISQDFEPHAGNSLSVTIDVYEPVYEHPWFWPTVFVLIAGLCILAIIFYNRSQFEKSKALWSAKDDLVRDRNRLARELHDSMGAQLSIINRNINWIADNIGRLDEKQLNDKLTQIAEMSAKANSDIRDTIWASKKEALSIEEIFGRLHTFLYGITNEGTSAHFKNEAAGIILKSYEAINVLRICQEAILNATKYSQATEINIVAGRTQKVDVFIIIRDNGRGFDLTERANTGEGLNNMAERAAEIGFVFEIFTEVGNGCVINLKKSRMHKREIKIGIVDDNRQTLRSLCEMLSYEKRTRVIFTANDGKDFLKKMQEVDIDQIPEVVLMDLDMKMMGGIEAIVIGRIKFPQVKYIVLTVFDDEERLFESIKAGASGYLLKDEKISVITEHIVNLVEQGYTPMSPNIAKKTFELLSKVKVNKGDFVNSEKALDVLSEREVEVMKLLMEGQNYRRISEILFISPNTVKKHIAHIYEKLHVTSKTQMINLVNKIW
ncbi:MAG: response regulator [Saprospiraceae bacterium]|nr:response regulator [Saprospiraceae bacterium]